MNKKTASFDGARRSWRYFKCSNCSKCRRAAIGTVAVPHCCGDPMATSDYATWRTWDLMRASKARYEKRLAKMNASLAALQKALNEAKGKADMKAAADELAAGYAAKDKVQFPAKPKPKYVIRRPRFLDVAIGDTWRAIEYDDAVIAFVHDESTAKRIVKFLRDYDGNLPDFDVQQGAEDDAPV